MTRPTHNSILQATVKTTLLATFIGTLSSCQASTGTTTTPKVDEKVLNIAPLTSVLDMFSCKPADLAFVAAHRGTHEGSEFPENALESLKALHARGVQFAEIDVARLRGKTQILYHDGTWERGSTGKGPIAVTSWEKSQTLLLKNTNGALTSFRPSSFSDVLSWSKDKMYLEIDFKSSVDEAQVIETIRQAEMIDQVILISYNTDQALRLHKLAPKAALSVGIFKPGDIKALEVRGIPTKVMTAWTGRGPLTQPLVSALRDRNIPILAASFFSLDNQLQQSKDFSKYAEFAKLPDLIVTDFAFDAQKPLEIKGNNLVQLQACLNNK